MESNSKEFQCIYIFKIREQTNEMWKEANVKITLQNKIVKKIHKVKKKFLIS